MPVCKVGKGNKESSFSKIIHYSNVERRTEKKCEGGKEGKKELILPNVCPIILNFCDDF